jgi:exosortase A
MTVTEGRTAPFPLLQALLLGAVLLFPVVAYFGTAASIVAIWQRSETFAHGYVILPIVLWLVWQRRGELRQLPVQPCWPALAALAACGFGWLLADLGEVQIIRQYAFAAMLPLTALAMLGLPIARLLAFPLVFILFAVPFGEAFVEPLINVTANFTVKALQLTGIPVFREGNNFSIPSGNWSVVEACSGVRYLISSVTLGCLYAYLTYTSNLRRGVFIVLSTLVPILANGLRAYMIVMMGHLSGMTMAVGFDHLIYGWVFFGLVMFLLFWIGSYWRQDPVASAAPAAGPAPSAPLKQLLLAGAAVVAVSGIWPAWVSWMDRSAAPAAPVHLAQISTTGSASEAFAADWQPEFGQPAASLVQHTLQGQQPVGLALHYYRRPAPGVKLISSANVLAGGKDSPYHRSGTAVRTIVLDGRELAVRESTLVSTRGGRLLVWQWYWIDGVATSNDYRGKLLQIKQKLTSGSDDGAAVMVFSPYEAKPEAARAALEVFLKSNIAAIDAALAANHGP